MLFSSITFLYCFLPCVLLVYFVVPDRMKNTVLLLASLFFYGWGEPKYLIFMLASVTQSYAAALLVERFRGTKIAKAALAVSAAASLGLLAYCKYADFFIGNFNAVTGLSVPLLRVALPVGISFYTFQILSYVIDVYRGDVPVQRNFIDLAMYVAMFPQLIAGPIVRYSDIAGSLKNRKTTLADAFMSFKSMFGFAGIPAVNAASLYYLKSNLVLLIVAAVGATPLPRRIYEKIGGTAGGSRVLAVLTPMAAAAAVAVCTAYLIDGLFNPFVYFRF
ncbi:MAG: hypothetical protein MR241_06940 [Firmicutes bacterium]|uniref:Transcriptional regulator n=1 Tax=Candidatus Colimorpha enterica TaxID=3083063 RepID=A0AAE3FHP4_9BACT|nr:hypothetical protein [Candidatus Colimorpha enterica]